jgi:spermidine synthase
MRLRQRLGFRAGIAILAGSTALLVIALQRVAAALLGQHLALAVLPLALAGAGLGGLALHLWPGLVRPQMVLARLGHLACLTSAATLASLLVVMHTKAPEVFDRASLPRLAALAAAALLPFFFAGLLLVAGLRHAGRDTGRIGFTVFAAAALAGPLAVAVLRVGAPRAVLITQILDGLGALGFYLAARVGTPETPRARGGLVATAILAGCVLFLGDLGAPWLKIQALRWAPIDKVEAQEWTALGLVTVDKPAGGSSLLRLDGTAAVPIYEAKSALPALPEELAFVLHKEPGAVLILGVGGGREVRVAEKAGQKDLAGVEVNGLVVRTLLRDRFKKYAGEVLDRPGLELTVEDPRVFLRHAGKRYRSILVPLGDDQIPAGTGALAAEPTGLYTVEALHDALERLTPDGALVVSRWDADFDRLLGTAAAALRVAGIADPERHLFACGAARSTALLVARATLQARELTQLRAHCRKHKLNEAYAPDQPHGDLRRKLTTEPDVAAAVAAEPIDLSPPTDDRPYFFWGTPRARLLAVAGDLTALRATGQALLVLLGAGVVTASLLLLGLIAGAARTPRERERGARLAPIVYFAALCSTLALAAAAFALRLPVLLGHPGHALTTVLVTLLAFAAGGSLIAWRVPSLYAEEAAGYRAQMLAVLLAAVAVGVGPLVGVGLGLPAGARLAAAVLLLAPFGLLLGSLFAMGWKLLAARTPELVPFSLGAGLGAAGLAVVVGTLLLGQLGAGAALLAAAAAALLAAAAVPHARR